MGWHDFDIIHCRSSSKVIRLIHGGKTDQFYSKVAHDSHATEMNGCRPGRVKPPREWGLLLGETVRTLAFYAGLSR